MLDDAETEENWKRLCEKLDVPTSVNLTDYVNVDCDEIVQKEITDDDILADMSDGNPCDDEVEEEDVPQSDRQSLTLVQATNMARRLQDFHLSRSDVPESVLNSCTVVATILNGLLCLGVFRGKSHTFSKNEVQNIVYRYNVKFDMLKNYSKPLAITVYHYFMYIYPNFPLI